MKLSLVTLAIFFTNISFAQNFTDTIASLNLPIGLTVSNYQDDAQKYEKKASPERKKWKRKLTAIKELEANANQSTEAKQKRKLLVKVLQQKKEAEKLQGEYIESIEKAHISYFKAVHELYKDAPKPKNADAASLAASLEGHALKKIKKAKSKRKKAERVGDDVAKIEALIDASEAEQAAISDLVYAIKLKTGEVEIIVPETYTAKAMMEENYNNATVFVASEAIVPPQTDPFQEINIIYKVQIAASKEELSTEKIMEIYTPKAGERIVSEIEDEWYKYSVGRFHTYTEANAYKEVIQVEGAFIVAYKDNKKIVVPEVEENKNLNPETAKTLSQNTSERNDIVYRIQISATRQPANLFSMKGLNLGGRSVNIIQKDGWYKYTIGSFETKEQALDSLKQLDNKDAFVVGFTLDGEEIKIK